MLVDAQPLANDAAAADLATLAACVDRLRRNPFDVSATEGALVLAVRGGNLELAQQLFQRLRLLGPQTAWTPAAFAQLLQREGRNDEALEFLEDLLQREPANPAALKVLACVHRARGDLEATVTCYDLAARLDPRQAAHAALGECFLELDRPDDALAACQALLGRGTLGASATDLLRTALVRWFNAANGTHFLNIGGSPAFLHPRWTNLEAVPSPANPTPFRLSPTCVLPCAAGIMRLVYSSHCLEHLDDATVARVLAEARRCVSEDGALVLKLPDFVRVLAAWRSRTPALFSDALWGFDGVASTWPARGVPDSLDTRAAMIFCGFWNDAYGGGGAHFAKRVASGNDAYHGPPVLTPSERAALLALDSPHEIAARLRARALAADPTCHFNHQNAWSRAELTALLADAGFETLSFDAERICQRYACIPDIQSMQAQSLYCLAVPDGTAR
jgi:tetratricopeptide (TPR) repeat protein